MLKILDAIIKFSCSKIGIALYTFIGGAIMMFFTKLTEYFNIYKPLSYYLAFTLGIILTLIIIHLIVKIYIAFTRKITTSQLTYIEYKIENNRSNLLSKQNIYKVPSVVFQEFNQTLNRQDKRNNNKNNTQQAPILSASILVIFDKFLKPADMHVTIERGIGECPRIESYTVDERWSQLNITQIENNSSFKIIFNKSKL